MQASQTPGSYQLVSLPWGIDYQIQPQFLLATMVVEGARPGTTAAPHRADPVRGLEPGAGRITTASRRSRSSGPPLFFAIDGKHFDANRIDQTVKLRRARGMDGQE